MRGVRWFAIGAAAAMAGAAAFAHETNGTISQTRIWRPVAISGIGDPTIRIPEVGSPEWKIDHEKRARERAEARASRIEERQRLEAQGVNFLGGAPPESDPEPVAPAYVGTRVLPSPDAHGEELEAQVAFAAAMERSDPEPASRQKHFSWMPRYDGMYQIGWQGRIVMTETLPAGRLVVVQFQPMLHSPFRSLMRDYVEETYTIGPDGLHLISTDAEIDKPFFQHYPLAI